MSEEERRLRTRLTPLKLAFHQGFDFSDGLQRVVPSTCSSQFAAGPGGEHHQAHDALAVDLFAVLFHEDLQAKRLAILTNMRGGPGVDAQLVAQRSVLWS